MEDIYLQNVIRNQKPTSLYMHLQLSTIGVNDVVTYGYLWSIVNVRCN